MRVTFWGTRGSVASPGPHTARFGGNTSCVEVAAGESLAILDCGTGARELGVSLLGRGGSLQAHILLTHFHWDHIQGFPFFVPVFLPGSDIHVYGIAGLEQGLAEALSGQMQYTYFPVRLSELASQISFHEIAEGAFQAGQFSVEAQHLNHTCPTLGYRLSAQGRTVAYVTDHEPFWPHNPDRPLATSLIHPRDLQHVSFIEGVDLLIHDAQYTADEYAAKRGWGHSTVEYVVDIAIAARVPQLALFHHDPPRSDDALDTIVERARARARKHGSDLDIFAAREGQSVDLPERLDAPVGRPRTITARREGVARILVQGSPEVRRSLREALVEDNVRIMESAPLADPADLRGRHVDLVIAAPAPGVDLIETVRHSARLAPGRPVVAVVDGDLDDELLLAVSEHCADVVVRPFGGPNLRARVRACLARWESGVHASTHPPSVQVDPPQLVDQLSTSELAAMLNTASRCTYEPGEVLFREGDPPRGVYYIHDGLLRIVVAGDEQPEVTVGFAGPGDTVGEMSALDGQPRSATAHVLRKVDASFITRDAFRHALEGGPETSSRVMRLLARRVRNLDRRLAGQSAGPSDPIPPDSNVELLSLTRELRPGLDASSPSSRSITGAPLPPS